MNELNTRSDYSTGLAPSARDLVEDAVYGFNERHGVHGWDATIEWFAWGDYSINVTRDGRQVASIYDDLDEFEHFEGLVDEGYYEEASAWSEQ